MEELTVEKNQASPRLIGEADPRCNWGARRMAGTALCPYSHFCEN